MRASAVMSDGEVREYAWYERAGTPEILLQTTDRETALRFIQDVSPAMADLEQWQRRGTDAVVHEFSDSAPTSAELDEAATDLVLETIEVNPDGAVVLHFDDSCGEHFSSGHWPAVRYDREGVVEAVTIEA